VMCREVIAVIVVSSSLLLHQVDNDDYVRRVLKTDDTKPALKSESQHESSSRSKVSQSHTTRTLLSIILQCLLSSSFPASN